MAFTPVLVTRQYYDADMTAAAGTVTFIPTSPMVNEGTVIAGPVVGTLDPQGLLSILLAANDDVDTVPNTPEHASYRVLENLVGQPRREYYVQVPADAVDGTIDLAGLNAASVPPVVTYPAPGPQGPPGADSTVEGPPGADGLDGADGADGVGIPIAGTTGQYLRKASDTDYDSEWATLPTDVEALVSAKGSVLAGAGAGDLDEVTVGANGRVLAAASGETAGVAWQANPTPAPVALVETSIAIDAAAARVFDLAVTAARTLPSPTNATDGRVIIVRHRVSGGTSRLLSLTTGSSGSYKVPTDFTITTTPSGTCDVLAFLYDGTQARWILVGYVKGA